MEILFQHLTGYYRLSKGAQDALANSFEIIQIEKGEFLLKKGRICSQLYFLETGLIRGYYDLEEKEITHWFAFENSFVTSFHSFITQQPAVENLQCLENCTLWRITKEKLHGLFNAHHDIERLVRIAYESYYIRLEERYVNAHFKSAAERYRQLLEESPQILERVSLGQIASYLGISAETLSRIRSAASRERKS